MPGIVDGPFAKFADFLLDKGVRPNHVSFLQLPVYAAMLYFAWTGKQWAYFGLAFVPIFLDGLDGIIARRGNLQSRAGAILDAVLDLLGIVVVIVAAAWMVPAATIWLIFLGAANLVLYLQNAYLGRKAVSYLRGPIVLGSVLPHVMLAALVLVGITTILPLVVRLGAPRSKQPAA